MAGGQDALRRNVLGGFSALLQDVLNYNRVLRDHAPLTPIDLGQLLSDLQASYPGWSVLRAEVQVVGPLPTVLGHAALLAQCFSNLVGNAIRFVAPGVQPRVRLWAVSGAGNTVRVNVQDNGLGIAPEHHERVFGMFQRLHPASQYEGTGIGLTIVRRAVERMRGWVGFDSVPGQGSTFWVELARAEIVRSQTAV